MTLTRVTADRALVELDQYDRIIDARSPGEFTLDRLPGAVNWPTLDDEQRHAVGTEYKQVSAFDARKRGAVMAARNIADHVERELGAVERGWRPLVYCWRGGKRSGSLAMVLDQIGFRVAVLDGGYQAFRKALVGAIDSLALDFRWNVLCGTTGSGKSRLLQLLHECGAQVLDLEQLAAHRGSVLGLVPGEVQPSQKAFDTCIWDVLRRLDPSRPVWVESESSRVGALRVPEMLITAIRRGHCWRMELTLDARVALLMEDYSFFTEDVDSFCARLDALRTLRGNAVIDRWQALARGGDVEPVVRELLVEHYDPIYLRSIERNFSGYADAQVLRLADGNVDSLRVVAGELTGAG